MNDKGTCGDCGRVSFLDDCHQSPMDDCYKSATNRYTGANETDYECPHCEEGYITEFDQSTYTERTVRKVDCNIVTIKLKISKHYRITKQWLDDAFHPGRQKAYRSKIHLITCAEVNLRGDLHVRDEHIRHLNKAMEKDVLSAVQMLARNIDVSVGMVIVPAVSQMPVYKRDDDNLSIMSQPNIKTIVREERTVLARMQIIDCHELKKIHIRSKQSFAMYSHLVADGLSHALTPFVMKEIFKDMTDEHDK